MEFRARKCNYKQMLSPAVSLIDRKRMEMISATSINGNKGQAPTPTQHPGNSVRGVSSVGL